jgi:hypothetical protein
MNPAALAHCLSLSASCAVVALAAGPLAAARTDSATVVFGDLEFEAASVRGQPGYFRVARTVDGQWWFIDPDDQPFFYRGVCAINRAGTMGGRRARPGPYAETVDRLYDYPRSPEAFVEACFARLRAWGFNAAGAWTTAEFFDRGLPYTEILEFFYVGPHLQFPGERRARLPDVFDTAWGEAIDAVARELCTPRRDSRDLVGYFTDNEIGFGRAEDHGFDPGFEAGTVSYSLLRQVLALPAGVPAREAAWEFVRERHGGLAGVASAWGVALPDEAALAELNAREVPIDSATYTQDAQLFVQRFAERYFRLAAETVRRHAPNHLLLGCRFGAPPPAGVLAAIVPHTDVISANNYRPALFERYDPVYRAAGLPILIGEFSWNTELFRGQPFPDEPPGGLGRRERMFRRGADTLQRMATHPGIVGYTWYRWVQPRSTAERFTDGLVDYDDQPDIHHPVLAQLNPQLETLRRAHARPPAEPGLTGFVRLWFDHPRPEVRQAESVVVYVTAGQWHREVVGWRFAGESRGGQLTGQGAELEIVATVEAGTAEAPLPPAQGRYRLQLQRDGDLLTGTWSGEVDGRASGGAAHGWFLREFPPPALD